MTLWMLLQAIAFTTAMFSGWMAGKPDGIVGVLIGLLVGAVVGCSGVWSMYHAGWGFNKWITKNKLTIKIELLASLILDVAGLAWCFVIGAIVQVITRFLI